MKIALIGKIRSGKSTAARYLEETHGFEVVSFGDPVKEAAAGMMNALEAYIHGGDIGQFWSARQINAQKDRPEIRHLLQLAGDSLGRGRVGGQNAWIDKTIPKIDKPGNIVIDDCRYQNEFDMLVKRGFFMIRIERNEPQRQQELVDRYGFKHALQIIEHPSETALDKVYSHWDFEAKELKDIYNTMDRVVKYLQK